MARSRTLKPPPRPNGDTGWKRLSGETYHREIHAYHTALIAHVAPLPRPDKGWTACVTVKGAGGSNLVLDALAKGVPEGCDLCDASLGTLRRELAI